MKQIIAELGVETGATLEAIKKWRQRGGVPPKSQLLILDLVSERGLSVTRRDFVFPTAKEMRKANKKTRRPSKPRKVAA